jgi:hypothetical protein
MNKKRNARLSLDTIKLIRDLTNSGKSLRHISKEIGINITTIYYQVRKFKPKIKKEFVANLSDFQIGELIGAFAGDGSYYHVKCVSPLWSSSQHKIRYHLSLKSDKQYANHLFILLKRCSLNPFKITRKECSRLDILINSKELIIFIKKFLIWEGKKTYSVRLTKRLNSYSIEFLKGFARGLMDTDGYVEISNASFACASEKLIKDLTLILDSLGIKYKLSKKVREGRHDLFLVRIYRESLQNYLDLIGFSNKYKLKALENIINKNRKD